MYSLVSFSLSSYGYPLVSVYLSIVSDCLSSSLSSPLDLLSVCQFFTLLYFTVCLIKSWFVSLFINVLPVRLFFPFSSQTLLIYQFRDHFVADIDGGYSDWSCWSDCSQSCGGGSKMRTRECTNPSPQGKGKDCSGLGEAQETHACNNFVCPSG